jgi:putative ABC transport system permease protein
MPDPSSASGARPVEPGRDWNDELRVRLAPLHLHPTREAEIVDELSQHLDLHYEELRRGGTADAEARRLAARELLGPEALAAYLQPLRTLKPPAAMAPGAPRRSLLRDLAQDLRYALASFRRQPGFAAGAILTLALGIGANSAIFALVDATLLRPLPIPQPDRAVMISERTASSAHERVSPNNLMDFAERNRSFETIAGYMRGVGGMVMGGADGTAETVSRQWVTGDVFAALGVNPIVGRTLTMDDDRRRADAVVLSESFWRTRFNGDPAIVGRDLRLDGAPYNVVGVVPDSAQLIGKTDLWGLISIHGAPPRARGARVFQAVGRLKPGVSLAAADADLSAVASGLAEEFPVTNAGRGVTLEPFADAVIGADLRRTSILFLGVVAFVLLICCANVANLLLARATVRSRELAIRSALGADRRRLIRQLLTESVVLSILGGALGLVLGAAILQIAPSIVPDGLLPPAVTLAFDLRLVAFCAAAALFVGVLFGLAPAWQATALQSAQALAANSRGSVGGGSRLRNLLVAGEVATAVLLLVGAGLLLRTLMAVQNVDRGYRAESVLTMVVDPLGSEYPTTERLLQFYDRVAQEARALPGVRSVAWASTLPMGTSYGGTRFVSIAGDPPPQDGKQPSADYQVVDPSYFQTVDLPVVDGRAFDERDISSGVPVCIVNEAFVRAHLQGRSPIGARVSLRDSVDSPASEREIVGVARQVKGRPDEIEDFEQVYIPMAQDPLGDMFLVVRPASGSASVLAPSVRAAIARVDKQQLVSVRSVTTLEDVAWEATGRHRFRAVLVTAFAGLALVLAMVGLFGILAYSVQRRVRDLGVRRALGATTGDVVRAVLGGAAQVVAAGMLAGIALSVVLGRVMESMLFGVQPLDPLTFVLVAAVLGLTALVAVAGPAWKATRVDPVVALRTE